MAPRFAARSLRSAFFLEDETAAYLARLSARPRIDWINALDIAVARGNAYGWWPKIARNGLIGLFNARGSISDCGVNLLSRKWSAWTIPAGATQPDWTPYVGIKGDGVGKYMLPGLAMGDMPEATASNYAVFSFSWADQINAGYDWAALGGGPIVGIKSHDGGSAYFDATTTTTSNEKIQTACGFNMVRRFASDHFVARMNGAEQSFTASAASSLPSNALAILRAGATGATYSSAALALFGMITDASVIADADAIADIDDTFTEFFLSTGVVNDSDLNPSILLGTNCWGPADIGQVSPAVPIWRNTAPPSDADTAATFPRFPLTVAATVRIDLVIASTWTGGKGWAWNWVQRSNLNPALNGNAADPTIRTSAGLIGTSEFDSVEKADAGTLARTRWLINKPGHAGDGSGYLDALNAVGLPDAAFVTWAAAAASPDTVFTSTPSNGSANYAAALNTAISHNAQLSGVPSATQEGILFDIEVADGRTTQGYFQASDEARAAGYKTMAYLNELTGGNASKEGLGPAVNYQFFEHFDFVAIMSYFGNVEHSIDASILAQLNTLTGPDGSLPIPYEQLVLIVGAPAALSADDAAVNHSYIAGTRAGVPAAAGASTAFGGSIEWPDNETPGGALSRAYNQGLAGSWGMSLT